jgi:hypothetical protein
VAENVYRWGKDKEITGRENIKQKLENEERNSKRRFWLTLFSIVCGSPFLLKAVAMVDIFHKFL